ncbi:MAG: MarR family [Labilithrix sp.]|nr:MarR family [Labilithrix sp.]
MHPVFFGVKRVHIEVVRFTDRLLRCSGLTPARFDMLRIVKLHPDGIPQATLRWLLGVTAPVVSRMLKALQEKGLVARERDTEDGRCRIVRLTERGKVAVHMGLELTIISDEADRTAARAATGDTRVARISHDDTHSTIRNAREKVAQADGFLRNMRKALFDRAPFHHPWRPWKELMPVAYTQLVDGRIQYGNESILELLA